MRDSDIRNRWALVTGASSGLGVDFARELARRGCNPILVARREERLRALAAELSETYGVDADVVPMDLGARDAPERLYRAFSDRGRRVDILINNAGFGVHGKFLDNAWERERAMLELNIIALVQLTKLFAAGMVERGFGRILQVASTAAYQPVPTYAAYGASKAFVLSFGEALNHELKGTGVTCTVVSPGVTETEFQTVAGHEYNSYMRLTQMKSADVARIGIRAMLRGRSSVIAGLHNALLAGSGRLTPRRLTTALAGFFMKARG
jgi:short-subunit dehydrogenase